MSEVYISYFPPLHTLCIALTESQGKAVGLTPNKPETPPIIHKLTLPIKSINNNFATNNFKVRYIFQFWVKLLFSSLSYTVHCPNREPRQSGRLTPNKTETPLITQSRHYTNPYFHLSKWNRNSDSVLCWLGVTWPQPYFSILAKIFPICYGNFSYCHGLLWMANCKN